MAKKKTKSVVPFFRYLAIALALITIITLGLFKFIDVLPGEYFFILCALLGLITLGISLLILTKRGPKKRVVGTILALIYMVFLILVIIYELNTLDFLKRLGFKNFKTENYSVLVLKDSSYEKIKDLNKKTVGSLEFNSDGLKEAKKRLDNNISVNYKTYQDVSQLKEDLLEKEVEGIIIENSILAILDESDETFRDNYKIIYDFSLDIEIEDIAKDVDITKDAFNIFVTGIDTYGSISSVSRSDVNMIITVNPKTHKVLITSIPRDYYVTLASKNAKDKLTHAGIYGVDESVKTLENLLDIKINYYVKVNFTSLIKVVDALGGVDVYSDYNFTSIDGYSYKKGYNTVNGEKALSFVRERKSFNGGDRVRVENQANMIKAMIDKAISPAIITKYSNLLKTLGNSFVTNLDMEAITEFIKMQIDNMKPWDVDNILLDGTDAYEATYSYGNQKLYVMMPDLETVNRAKLQIKGVLN